MTSFELSDHQRHELAARGRVRVSCGANGHCFPYATYDAMLKERGLDISFDQFCMQFYQVLKLWPPDYIRQEGDAPVTAELMEHMAHRYVFHYNDNNPIVDVAPHAMAKLFKCNIIILEPDRVSTVTPPEGVVAEVCDDIRTLFCMFFFM